MQATVSTAKVPVLVVSPCPEDHIKLGKILHREHWDLRHAFTCNEAQQILQQTPVLAILAEAQDDGVCWQKMLAIASRTPFAVKPHVVVMSAKADDRLWSEVLNMGGYNVLAKPFEPSEVRWVLEGARLDWLRQEPALIGEERQRLSA